MLSMNLFELTQLAKKNPPASEQIIADFVYKKFQLKTTVTVNQSAVSLNSVNGQLVTDTKQKLFFKFHAEEGESATQSEYYNGQILAKNGFDIIAPLYQSTDIGEQFLIYPYRTDPTFFDVCAALDEQFLTERRYDETKKNQVLCAEKKLCQQASHIAAKTFAVTATDIVAQEPIWQLFSTRLLSKKNQTPRIDLYYGDKTLVLPDQKKITFADLATKKWIINGRRFDQSLSEIITDAKQIISPATYKTWGTIVAHGDDHNGNKFFDENDASLRYFDPAFAGQYVPVLLAPIKTIFHDTLAHPFWLYSPKKIEEQVSLNYSVTDDEIIIDHNWDMAAVAPVRQNILEQKLNDLLVPTVELLRAKNLFPDTALEFVKKALFCCPFLVLNLIDYDTYSPKMSLLALSKSIEMGSLADSDDYLDQSLRAILG